MLKKQLFHPSKNELRNAITANAYALAHPEGLHRIENPNEQSTTLIYRNQSLLLKLSDTYNTDDSYSLIKQEHYIKCLFCLNGKHTTVFDGIGQHEIDQPQVLITAGPSDIVKVDMMNGAVRQSHIAICITRDFFCNDMAIDPDSLPEPFRSTVTQPEMPFIASSVPLTANLSLAAQSMLMTQLSTLELPDIYFPSKATELLCLLLGQMNDKYHGGNNQQASMRGRKKIKLYEVRDYLTQHYTDTITLDQLAKMACISKTVMTSGFMQLFGMSIFDFIHRERMTHAYQLLQHREHTIAQVANKVGYQHPGNFSTAFHHFFGFPPKAIYSDATNKSSTPICRF